MMTMTTMIQQPHEQQQRPGPPPSLTRSLSPRTLKSPPPTPPSSSEFVRQLDHLHDVLSVMRQQERIYYHSNNNDAAAADVSRRTRRSPSTGLIIAAAPWRSSLVQWMSSVVDIFQLAPQIVATGMYFLDQSSSLWVGMPSSSTTTTTTTAAPTRHYALLGMTCLELAIKMHDTKIFPLLEMTRMGLVPDCSVEDIVHMEGILMQALQWKLNPPTPHCFIHQYGLVLEAVLVQHYHRFNHQHRDHHHEAQTLSVLAERVQELVEEALGLVRLCLYYYNDDEGTTIPPAVAGYAALLAAMEQPRSFHCVLPTSCKQDFARYMVTLTGLSASSPGLVQAYQLVSMMKQPPPAGGGGYGETMPFPTAAEPSVMARVASPTHIASMPTTAVAAAPSPMEAYPLQYHRPIPHHCGDVVHCGSMSLATTSPMAPLALAYSSPMTTTTSTLMNPNTHDTTNPSRNGDAHHHRQPLHQPKRQQQHQQEQEQQQEMIYSAGEELGFEVTLNPFDDDRYHYNNSNHHNHRIRTSHHDYPQPSHDDEDDYAALNKNLHCLSLHGWSPRDILGA